MFDEDPRDDWWTRWVLGTAVPVLVAAVGLACIVTRYARLPGRRLGRNGLVLHDTEAIWVGVAILAAAAFVHVHHVWRNVSRLAPFAELAMLSAAGLGVLSLGVVLWRFVFVM